MGKQKRIRQTAVSIAPRIEGRITHEPEVPNNWPRGHVSVQETSDHEEECIIVTVHGIQHYLHATTAYELYKMLGETITKWDKVAKAHGAPGVIEDEPKI